MKKQILQYGVLTVAAIFGLQSWAVPAKPGLRTVSQPDGSTITVELRGDEFFHQYLTEDGYPLIEKDGYFYYSDYSAAGDVINSGIRAVAVSKRDAAARDFLARVDRSSLETRIRKVASRSPRRASMVNFGAISRHNAPAREASSVDGPPYERGYGLFSDLRFPAYGEQKSIVILVEYKDVKFKTSYDAKEYFTNMLNQDGFSDYNGTGSAAQFFKENSNGAFVPEFDVYGPITLSQNQSYYGGNDWWGNDEHPADMVKEACDQLDDEVDFSQYDRNGDGIVDNIYVFYAGQGEASGGSANTVWPHSWNMVSAGYPNLMYDGVQVYTYGCSNEWEGSMPDGVGTFVHEFSHVIGIPDIYATSYTGAFTPGAWSAMDYGPYNNNGRTPPNYGAYERYALGWMKPREIDGPLSATLQPIAENAAGVIRTAKDTEFFLLENRQQEGWDKYIPGHGMLIWHIDYNQSVFDSNQVNNTSSHQYVDIEEADGTQNEYSRDGDAFPGTSNKTSFTGDTSPALKTWSNTKIDLPITDISEYNGLITFKVSGGGTVEVPNPEVFDAEDVLSDQFTIRWTPVEGYDAIVSVYTRMSDNNGAPARLLGNEVFVPGFKNKNVGDASSVTVTGLDPLTLYYFTVTLTSGWYSSETSEERTAYTGKRPLNYSVPEATEALDLTENSFKATWLEVEDANDYLLNVYTKVQGDPVFDVQGFDNGVSSIGGWTSSSASSYSMATYSGKKIPALRMANGNSLESPSYSDYVNTLRFWHRGNNTSTGDQIQVYAISETGSVSLVSTVEVSKVSGGTTTTITDFPENTVKVRIQFVRNGENGALALDDVEVGHGYTTAPEYFGEFLNYSVGNVLEFNVTGLNPDTDYYYTISATDGTLVSRLSNEVLAHTLVSSSVSKVLGEAFALSYNSNVVTASTDDLIIVCDYTGALVARGAHKVTLPRAGLYVVSVPARNYTKKIIVK
ncbi:MAG: M6 family metalloprotease domain-containing protein [Lepagella sp.]